MNSKTKRQFLAYIAVALLLGFLSGRDILLEKQAERDQQTASAAEAGSKTGAQQLTVEEKECLSSLESCLNQASYEEAARLLLEQESLFGNLFFEKLQGKRFLFHDGALSETLEGRGLVLTGGTSAFYGIFAGGQPEGNGVAFQAIELGAPRYDYAAGFWSQGKLNGAGLTGYRYYETVPDGEAREITRKGDFKDDKMNGIVAYTTEKEADDSVNWVFQVQEGKTVLDEKWTMSPEGDAYQLQAEGDPLHAYMLKKEEADQPFWVNVLIWQ